MTELTTEKKPLHFVQLDALRFLAAFLIVIVHAWEGWVAWYGKPGLLTHADHKTYTWLGDRVTMLVHNMNFGVDMFFLISGFLITYLLLKEKTDKGKINIPAFFLRRVLRIWPLYFFVILVGPLIVWWLQQSSPDIKQPEYLPVIFFYNNFRTIATESWQFPFAHFWSICIEEHFYLVWPFLVALFPMKKLPHVFITVIVASIAYRAYASLNGLGWYPLYLHTLARIDVLAIGGLVAYAHFHRPYSLNIPLYIRLLLFGLLLWGLCYIDMTDWNSLFDAIWKKYIFLLLAGILMMNYVFSPNVFFKWGPKHIINYLGRCCFGIYLWGNILLQILIYKLFNNHPVLGYAPWWAYWPIVIGVSLVVPVISYELIEKPFLKLKAKFAIVKTRV